MQVCEKVISHFMALVTFINLHSLFLEFTLSMLGAHIGDERPGTLIQNKDDTAAGSPEAFMSSKLRFSTDANGQEVCMVDAGGEEVGVMMGWELPISPSVYPSHIL